MGICSRCKVFFHSDGDCSLTCSKCINKVNQRIKNKMEKNREKPESIKSRFEILDLRLEENE